MGLNTNQTLVSYSHKLCAAIVLTYLAGRTTLQINSDWIYVYISLLVGFSLSSYIKYVWMLEHSDEGSIQALARHVHVQYRRCHQQWGLVVSFLRTMYYLGNSLGHLGIAIGSIWSTTELDATQY